MPSKLHEQLIEAGARWLKRNGFSVIGTNIWAANSRERVDAIGFRSTCSVLIEAKASRSDFLADKKKPERHSGGVGTYRFYIAPPGLITPDDLPKGWGLIESKGRQLSSTVKPGGNLWPSYETSAGTNYEPFAHCVDEAADRAMLFSVARRMAK